MLMHNLPLLQIDSSITECKDKNKKRAF